MNLKKISLSLSVLVACSNHPVKATSYTKKCITTAIVATAFLTNKAQKHAPTTMARYRNHHMPPKVHTAHLPYASFLHRPKPTSHFYNGSTTSSTSKAALPIIAALGLCTGMGVYAGNHYDTTALCRYDSWLDLSSFILLQDQSDNDVLSVELADVVVSRHGTGHGRITVSKSDDYREAHRFFVKVKVRNERGRWITIARSPVFEMRAHGEYPIWESFFGTPKKRFYYEFDYNVDDIPDGCTSDRLGVSIHNASWWQ